MPKLFYQRKEIIYRRKPDGSLAVLAGIDDLCRESTLKNNRVAAAKALPMMRRTDSVRVSSPSWT